MHIYGHGWEGQAHGFKGQDIPRGRSGILKVAGGRGELNGERPCPQRPSYLLTWSNIPPSAMSCDLARVLISMV